MFTTVLVLYLLYPKILMRKEGDSNPRNSYPFTGFRDQRIRPLCHPSLIPVPLEYKILHIGDFRHLRTNRLRNYNKLTYWQNFTPYITRSQLQFVHFEPINRNSIDNSTRKRSKTLDFRFFSLNTNAPKINDTITLPRLTILTILIMASF